MNTGIKTFYALRRVTRGFLWFRRQATEVVGVTWASNWAWAELHLASDGIQYDELVQKV